MKTFVASGLQITAEARGKASAPVTDVAAAQRETEIVYTISVLCRRAMCSVSVCVNKCVGSRINNKPSIIDGHLLMCMHLLYCSLLMFYG